MAKATDANASVASPRSLLEPIRTMRRTPSVATTTRLQIPTFFRERWCPVGIDEQLTAYIGERRQAVKLTGYIS
jgi:hypothetical protein